MFGFLLRMVYYCYVNKRPRKTNPAQREPTGAKPLYLEAVAAGFPSPAEDYIDRCLDLNEHLIEHPAATFFVYASGNSMVGAGINDGDLLVVDRAVEPQNGSIVIAIIEGEFTVKRMDRRNGKLFLLPGNSDYQPIEITGESDFQGWGVCRYVIHQL